MCADIVFLFQKESVMMNWYKSITSSCFLVDIIKLIRVDYTLYQAKRLIIIDLKWMNWDQKQIKKHINWIDQHEHIYIYELQCKDFNIEKTIYDWQSWRIYLLKLVLNSKLFSSDDIIRNVNNDENDDDKVIEKKNVIRPENIV